MRSHLVENPTGRVFVHELGNGAALLVVECHGDNTSVVLDHDSVGAVVGALMSVSAAVTARPAAPTQVDPAPTAKPTPKAKAKPHNKGGRMSAATKADRARLIEQGYMHRDGKGLAYTDAFVEKVAQLYVEADDLYVGRDGRLGRVAYVMDQLDVSIHTARNTAAKARARGLFPPGFRAARGRPPTVKVNGQTEDVAGGVEKLRALVDGNGASAAVQELADQGRREGWLDDESVDLARRG